MKPKKLEKVLAESALKRHFGGTAVEQLITAARTFPLTARVDLQRALEGYFGDGKTVSLIGIHPQYTHETVSIAHLVSQTNYPAVIGPLQNAEVDIGEAMPARCLIHGLWLGRDTETRYAVLLTPSSRYGHNDGVHLEIAVPPGESGLEFSREFFREIEGRVRESGSYRGKVISLEASHHYPGMGSDVKVHKLRTVKRDEVILPERTLDLLERNVHGFLKQREALQRLNQPIKKGLLFYGPPGSGKTHTIHYLASHLHNHTTLLITAEQVGLLDEYFQLARFLQPAMVVIEDVDLIARAREEMRSGCEESLLNRLLNEMDGLREDAAILFVLTTNHPQSLEAALASRPGRVDQAIEFPLPDEAGRRKLVDLYARGLQVGEALVELLVRKTKGASPAFIKELMRRCAQYNLEENGSGVLTEAQLELAIEEMLFSGGSLNLKLLGASGVGGTDVA